MVSPNYYVLESFTWKFKSSPTCKYEKTIMYIMFSNRKRRNVSNVRGYPYRHTPYDTASIECVNWMPRLEVWWHQWKIQLFLHDIIMFKNRRLYETRSSGVKYIAVSSDIQYATPTSSSKMHVYKLYFFFFHIYFLGTAIRVKSERSFFRVHLYLSAVIRLPMPIDRHLSTRKWRGRDVKNKTNKKYRYQLFSCTRFL